ncbi:MAG: leucine-rich repeat domain-containing protein [Bacteroidota bacterium]
MKAFNLEMAQRQPHIVTELYIHNRGLRQVPESITGFPQLRKLDVSNNRLSELPQALLQLPQLEILVLSHNRFEQLPSWLHQLPQLKSIDFSYNRLQQLPEVLFDCQPLQHIALAHNTLVQLPAAIGQLNQLLYLDLSHNQIQELPAAIGQCTLLRELRLSRNALRELPSSLSHCRALRKLLLNYNRLKALPEHSGELTQLLQLSAAKNQLTQIPRSLGDCTSLNHVDLSSNQLSELLLTEGQWPQLMSLRLSRNQLRELPIGLSQCHWLQELDISRNQLRQLPDLSALKRLRQLNVERNRLTQLPQLPKRIEVLRLAKNPLPSVHPLVLEMERLKKLSSPEGAPQRKQLLRFYRAARRMPELSEAERLQLYDLFEQAEHPPPLSLLLKGLDLALPSLNTILIRLIKQQYGRPLQEAPLGKGVNIVLKGRTSISRQRLKKEIEVLGMHYQTQFRVESTHILLGQRPDLRLLPTDRKWVWLEERELYDFLRQQRRVGHTAQLSAAQLERLGQLLTSGQAMNVELALQMLGNGGPPPSLLTELFIAYKFAPTAPLRRRLRQLLELHCDAATAAMLRSRVSLNPRLPEAKRTINVRSYTANTALEEQKLISYLKKVAEQP